MDKSYLLSSNVRILHFLENEFEKQQTKQTVNKQPKQQLERRFNREDYFSIFFLNRKTLL